MDFFIGIAVIYFLCNLTMVFRTIFHTPTARWDLNSYIGIFMLLVFGCVLATWVFIELFNDDQ